MLTLYPPKQYWLGAVDSGRRCTAEMLQQYRNDTDKA
jgi:hypothetical protein